MNVHFVTVVEYKNKVYDLNCTFATFFKEDTKLRPIVPLHEEKVKEFLTTYWNFYHELRKYKENLSEKLAHELSEEFDEIFSTETGYEDLDERRFIRLLHTSLCESHIFLILKILRLYNHKLAFSSF